MKIDCAGAECAGGQCRARMETGGFLMRFLQ